MLPEHTLVELLQALSVLLGAGLRKLSVLLFHCVFFLTQWLLQVVAISSSSVCTCNPSQVQRKAQSQWLPNLFLW
jgi:hypothetical protein